MAQETISKDGLAPEVIAYIDGLESENSELADTLGAATDELEKAKATIDTLAKSETGDEGDDGEEEDEDNVLKGVAPEVVALIEKARAETADARKQIDQANEIAKGERDIRLTAEYISKAGDLNVATDTAALGGVLKTVAEQCDEQTFNTLYGVLKAAGEQVAKGALFTESGLPGGGGIRKAEETLLTKAQALIDSGKETDLGNAIRTVSRQDPGLASEYYNDSRRMNVDMTPGGE